MAEDRLGEERPAGNDVDPVRIAAAALGSRGGRKRAETMSPERRAEIARKAAQARWRS